MYAYQWRDTIAASLEPGLPAREVASRMLAWLAEAMACLEARDQERANILRAWIERTGGAEKETPQ